MNKALRVCDTIARQIAPSGTEREHVQRVADSLTVKLAVEAEREGLDAEIRLGGSVAKDTWLHKEVDIDIFLRVPTSLSRAELENRCIRAARRTVKGYPIIERFAEHPYVETHVEGIRVNIVPCYKVVQGDWRSATDRTPFHTDYVISHLSPSQKNDVRLLKAFLKGIEVYGADIRVSGFSGMLCETLIMYYGAFIKTLQEAQSWSAPITVDLERYYTGREGELRDLFEEPLIVIDPVDRGRNLAASISRRRLWEFVAASRAFLGKPSERFFRARRLAPLSVARFRDEMERRGWNIVAIKFGRVDAVVDVLWSQLYRTERALSNMLAQEDYTVTRSGTWSNERNLNLIVYELQEATLPPIRKHLGPHVSRSSASELFLQKHLRRSRNVSGPWVDNDRWAVLQLRESTDAAQLLRARIQRGGRQAGVASKIAPVLKRRCDVLAGRSLLSLYSTDPDLARFMTTFLRGRPAWLE